MALEPNRRNVLGLVFGTAGLAALTACSNGPTPDGPTTDGGSAAETGSSAAAAATGEVPAPAQSAPRWNLDDPASLTVIVNKHRPLTPMAFEPGDLVSPSIASSSGRTELLRAPAAEDLNRLAGAAKVAGVPFLILSAFRSYDTQVGTYNSWVSSLGRAQADIASARPGFSEHQTGLAVDIGDSGNCNLRGCFAEQPAGQWVKDNCHRFGFVVRYQPGMQQISGYQPEPWHLRYLGIEVASDVVSSGKKTLEDYFGLAAAPDYL